MCMEYWLTAKSKLVQDKGVVRLTDHLDMTIAVDRNLLTQTKHKWVKNSFHRFFLQCVIINLVIITRFYPNISIQKGINLKRYSLFENKSNSKMVIPNCNTPHVNKASFLWDIWKYCSPRSEAVTRGSIVAYRIFC